MNKTKMISCLVIGAGLQGINVFDALIKEAKRLLERSQRISSASWIVVDPDPNARLAARELLRRHGVHGRCFAELSRALNVLAEKNARRVVFVEAPTDRHWALTQQAAPLADVLVCEKPACLTADEFAGWRRLQAQMTRQGKFLRTNLTEVASDVVRAACHWLGNHPELTVDSAIYYRASNVSDVWEDRAGVIAHAPEDKSVHCVSAHVALTKPDRMVVDPDVQVHAWFKARAACVTAHVTFTKDGQSVPADFNSSVQGIPREWIDAAEHMEIPEPVVAASTRRIKGREAHFQDMRLGVLHLVPRRGGSPTTLAMNFVGKGDLRPWIRACHNGTWRKVPLPAGGVGGLQRIVADCINLAIGEPPKHSFLDVPGEEMVIQFAIDTVAHIEQRPSQRPSATGPREPVPD